MSSSPIIGFRVSAQQLNQMKELAENSQCSVGSIARDACKLYCEKTAHMSLLKRILNRSKPGDTESIVFSEFWGNEPPQNKLKIYVHRNAYSDLANLGKKVWQEVMEFLKESIKDGSILHKGQITTLDDGVNFICFRVNLVQVHCHFAPMQITILSVVK